MHTNDGAAEASTPLATVMPATHGADTAPTADNTANIEFAFDSIDSAIEDIRAGKMIIVVDDTDRENEGDLLMAAEKVTPAAVNFMTKFARGLICAPISAQRAEQLDLVSMVAANKDTFGTDFMVAVDAAEGVTTGISASDRSHTIRLLASTTTRSTDIVRPGHIFPLKAKAGGVLQRAGHTEAAVDFAKLAGFDASGVICEIMREDGEMARLPDLIEFKKKHNLKLCTIQDLITYRRARERLVEFEEKVKMPTDYGDFDLYMYKSLIDHHHHFALVRGDVNTEEPVLVRVHSECLTGDVFGSRRCDCGTQLHNALRCIDREGRGVLVYMRQEGRGIGIANKIRAYKLQEQGLDTVEANIKLGFPGDLREYGLGAQILGDLGVKNIRLLTNNPKKVIGLAGYCLKIVGTEPIRVPPNEHNEAYLLTKKLKMGHML